MEGKVGKRLLANFTVEPIDRKRKQETKILIQYLASEETTKAHTGLANLLHKQNCSESETQNLQSLASGTSSLNFTKTREITKKIQFLLMWETPWFSRDAKLKLREPQLQVKH